jgi:hypothetical protein
MWSEFGDRVIESPNFIKAAEEKIAEVRENLQIAQSRKKSYADKRRRELKFDVGDHIYLKVSPIHGTRKFRVRGKLAPRYIGPYCHTPFRERGNEAFIRVPRMFKSHAWQQGD